MTNWIAGAFLLVGAGLFVAAGIGLVRFPSPYARLHAAGKATTLGLVCLILAAAFRLIQPQDSPKLLLVALFQVATTPIASHVMARTAHRRHVPLAHPEAVNEWPEEAWADEDSPGQLP